jgi:outer membrane protein assembly factor BamB
MQQQLERVPPDHMQRWNPCEKVLGVNNVGNLVLKWSYNASRESPSTVAVANGVLYVGAGHDNFYVYALNASTGAKL